MPPTPPTIALIINPAAGRGRARRAGLLAADVLRRFATVHVTVPTGGPAASIAAVQRAREAGVDAVVLCGGDGLVHLAANVLVDGQLPLGVVPGGSGNDIADMLGMSADPACAAGQLGAILKAGTVTRIDVGRCDGPRLVAGTDRVFVGLLYAGFDSDVNLRANRLRYVPARSRYNIALAIEAARLGTRRTELTIGDETFRAPTTLVAVGNGFQYGGGKRIAPHARWNDGVLGVAVIGPVTRWTLARLAPTLPRAGHVGHPAVLLRDVERIRLGADRPTTAFADGERVGPLPITAWTSRCALPVLVP